MVTSERLTRRRRRELTRGALLDAAARVFARRGFHAATLDEIAEAAGFTKGAIYSNFGSKEELFFAVADRRNREQLEEFRRALAGATADVATLLDRAAEALTAWQQQDRDWVLLETEVWLYAQRQPRARRRLVRHLRRTLESITAFVEETVTAAGLHTAIPPRQLAALMWAASTGIAQLHAADPEGGYERLFGDLLGLLADRAVVGPTGSD